MTSEFEDLKIIVKNTIAKLTHICDGKAFYQIKTDNALYQLEIDSTEDEFKTTHLYIEYKSITLMRWIRKGIETNNGSFIKLN